MSMPIRPIAVITEHFLHTRAKPSPRCRDCRGGGESDCRALAWRMHGATGICSQWVQGRAELLPARGAGANTWIDGTDKRVLTESEDINYWWRVFNDPVLDGTRVRRLPSKPDAPRSGISRPAARAQLAISVGSLFPQTQTASGSFSRNAASAETANNIFDFGIPGTHRFFSQWNFGFNLGWELDFWGRFPPCDQSNQGGLSDASVADYDDVLVTLLGDVATNYITLRTLRNSRSNYALLQRASCKRQTLTIVEARFKAGTTSELDVRQSREHPGPNRGRAFRNWRSACGRPPTDSAS